MLLQLSEYVFGSYFGLFTLSNHTAAHFLFQLNLLLSLFAGNQENPCVERDS